MNQRQAKIEALEIASGILYASCGTLETDANDRDHSKIEAELERIAVSLEARAKRLKERDDG